MQEDEIHPKALLFDLGGTLDADGVAWKDRFFRLYLEQGIGVSREAFEPVFYRADDALVGTIPRDLSLAATAGRLAAGITAGLGLADPGLSARVTAGFVGAAREAGRRSAAVLASLAHGHRLGIVSNFYGNLAAVCEDLGLRSFLDVLVDSTDAGCTKPDPRVFRQALEGLGVTPAEAVFVGDSPARDMAGARALGMRHVWLAGAAWPAPVCCPGDRVLRTLGELEGALA